MIEFIMEKIPQIAWHQQIKDGVIKSKKPFDKMPIAEIIKLYKSGHVLCDSCGKKMKISECSYDLIEHLTHLINPNSLWCCEGCYLEDKRKGRILAE